MNVHEMVASHETLRLDWEAFMRYVALPHSGFP